MANSVWDSAPLKFIPAITCPAGHRDYIIVRSLPKESDGSNARRCICRKCSQRFVVVVEVPFSGKDEMDTP